MATTESYVTQLLPTAVEARIIRSALYEYMERRNSQPMPSEEDICWKFISKISIDLAKHNSNMRFT